MEKLEKFTFEKEDGTTVEANVLGCFTVKEIGKTYLLYNIEGDSVEASLVEEKGNVLELKDITEEDKETVEKIITEVIGDVE